MYSLGEVERSSTDTFCLGLDFRTAWCSAALQQDESSALANYRLLRNGMQLTCTLWMGSENNPNDGIRNIYSSCQNMFPSINALTSFHWSHFARRLACKITQSTSHTEHVTVEPVTLDD